jgi:hypothetical protein
MASYGTMEVEVMGVPPVLMFFLMGFSIIYKPTSYWDPICENLHVLNQWASLTVTRNGHSIAA